MAAEVFNRYENKFIANEYQFKYLQNIIKQYMVTDKYSKDGFYTISNIYYDTWDDYLIRKSLEKPKYKEKVRLRAYGIPKENDFVYFEIKKKFNGIVNKRRSPMMLKDAYKFADNNILPELKNYVNKQVINEIGYVMQNYNLVPKVYLAYDRLAYFENTNQNVRVTVDFNIRSRRNNLNLELGDYGTMLLDEKTYLIEVKTDKGIPLWLTDALSYCKIYKTSFSKYGTEYRKNLSRMLLGEVG